MREGPITVALGGGGARGLAHLGVIEVLEDAGVPIERIVGVSIGSILGAVYAFQPDIRPATARVLEYLRSPSFRRHQEALYGTRRGGKADGNRSFFWWGRFREYVTANRLVHRVMTRPSFLTSSLLDDILDHLLPDADIADAKLPLTVVCVDLKSGKRTALERGPVRRAVRGSASLPGIFPPVVWEEQLLADVGIFCPVPTIPARSYGPYPLIAVDVTPAIGAADKVETALDVMMRMEEIGGTLFRDYTQSLADIVVKPNVNGLEWSDFSDPEWTIARGREAAVSLLPRILELVGADRRRSVSQPAPEARS